jgi:AraC family ethanolamine operon transcriptional activator
LPAHDGVAKAVLTTRRYRQIVDRFEDVARASVGKRRSIPEICATLAVGQRTLARAVRAVHGTTPSRHLHWLALAEARAALMDPATRSVRAVALRCGFRELGRFAAEYRAAFGEYPSQTLRRAAAAQVDDDTCVATPDARR